MDKETLWELWDPKKRFWNLNGAQDCTWLLWEGRPSSGGRPTDWGPAVDKAQPISPWNELWAHLSTLPRLLPRDLRVPVSTASNRTTGLGRDCCPWAALWPSPALFNHGPESVLPAQGLAQGPAWWPSKYVLGDPVEATCPWPVVTGLQTQGHIF